MPYLLFLLLLLLPAGDRKKGDRDGPRDGGGQRGLDGRAPCRGQLLAAGGGRRRPLRRLGVGAGRWRGRHSGGQRDFASAPVVVDAQVLSCVNSLITVIVVQLKSTKMLKKKKKEITAVVEKLTLFSPVFEDT